MERSKQPFDWRSWDKGQLPTLEPHSAAKLNVLRDYVEDYITILCSRTFGVERFRITLVDGFSGGGVYEENKKGSPFVLLKAVETAEAKLNDFGRIKKIKIDCDYHFVDGNRASIDCLRYQLEHSEYKGRINKSVFLHCGKFDAKYPAIVDRLLKRHSKGGARVIFFLDQCGYSQINPHILRAICEQLGEKVEFIINFAIEWLEDYIGDNKTFQKVFPKLGLDEVLPMEKLIRLRKQN